MHAGSAELVLHSGFIDEDLTLPRFATMYQDYIDADVTIINESFALTGFFDSNNGPGATYTAADHTRDWAARWRSRTITKSAGNNVTDNNVLICPPGGVVGTDTTVECHALNSICVGALDDSGTLPYTDDFVPCWSLSLNPKFAGTTTRKDAERPDVVMEGVFAFVASVRFPDNYIAAGHGTSFAAPAVAGMLAVTEELCGFDPMNPTRPATLRALLRNSAVERTAAGSGMTHIYPIPGFSPDARAGTGLPLAGSLFFLCDEQPPDPGPPEGEADLSELIVEDIDFDSSGWVAAPTEVLSEEPDDTDPISYDEVGQTPGPLKNGNNTVLLALGGPFSLSDGGRIRASLSFNTCPGGNLASAGPDVTPIRDLDLVVCDFSAPTPKCPGISQSNDDTNEGFDVIVHQDYSSLQFYLVGDSTETSKCRLNPVDVGLEPISLVWYAWNP